MPGRPRRCGRPRPDAKPRHHCRRMADPDSNLPPIVVKRVKKTVGGSHHGGAWKVAYADFVTAMMAFFLLLWLLNATTEEQRQAISNYFAPTSVSQTES